MSTAKAELKQPTGVGSSDLLGVSIPMAINDLNEVGDPKETKEAQETKEASTAARKQR